MSQEDREIWMQRMKKKYGSEKAVRKMMSQAGKKRKPIPPPNKIQDEYTDLPISRQQKHMLRKARG